MKRALLLTCAALVLLSCNAFAQATGQLVVKVQAATDPTITAAPAAGVKVMVVHWTQSGVHATLMQDQVLTTNQSGMCTANLPPGTYDVFVSASGLAPAAFRREVSAGETTSVTATLRPAPHRLRPVQ